MSFMGKTLSQLEAPFSTANSTARLVFAGSDLFTSSCFSFRQSSFSLCALIIIIIIIIDLYSACSYKFRGLRFTLNCKEKI